MMKLLENRAGPFGILVIALVLLLQTIMPLLKANNAEATSVQQTLTNVSNLLVDLNAKNTRQCEADKDNATEHKDITEALILLTATLGQVAHAMDKLELRMGTRGP